MNDKAVNQVKSRIMILVLSMISALFFALLFTKSGPPAGSTPKAWAHGIGFVLPRMIGNQVFALASVIWLAFLVRKDGWKKSMVNLFSAGSCLLLMPAVYVLLFNIRVFLAVF